MKKKIRVLLSAGIATSMLMLGFINVMAGPLDHEVDVVLSTTQRSVESAVRTTHNAQGWGSNSYGSVDYMIFELRQKNTIGSQVLESAVIAPDNMYWTSVWGREDVQVKMFLRLAAANPSGSGYTNCAGRGTLYYD